MKDAAKLYYDDVHKQAELKSHAQTEEEHKYAQLQEEVWLMMVIDVMLDVVKERRHMEQGKESTR